MLTRRKLSLPFLLALLYRVAHFPALCCVEKCTDEGDAREGNRAQRCSWTEACSVGERCRCSVESGVAECVECAEEGWKAHGSGSSDDVWSERKDDLYKECFGIFALQYFSSRRRHHVDVIDEIIWRLPIAGQRHGPHAVDLVHFGENAKCWDD